jgi:3-deoxy-D-manno-octulosonic-acid transferase
VSLAPPEESRSAPAQVEPAGRASGGAGVPPSAEPAAAGEAPAEEHAAGAAKATAAEHAGDAGKASASADPDRATVGNDPEAGVASSDGADNPAPDNRDPGPALRAREHVYCAAIAIVRPFARTGAGDDEKLQRGLAGRAASIATFEAWAAEHRDPDVPLVWMHAPSAGESLMAKAIIAALREARPDLQIAFTHFSPSAERLLEEVGADVAAYLPWDTRPDVRRALDALDPAVIAYVRSEVWPVLGAEAKRRGTRVALVNAALSTRSSRLRPAARWLLGPAYARLDLVGAVGPEDAALHARLGARGSRTRVTGDARNYQVLERLGGELPEAALRLADPDRVTLVAGSTWPTDEEHLLPAFFRGGTGARLVIAPHEPTEEHLVGIEDGLNRKYVRNRRLSDVLRDRQPLPGAVVVDRLGVLADLYRIADIAFVGGGFSDSGVHSVLEPAAAGIPVLMGPRHGNAREAAGLVAAGGGVEVTNAAQLEGRLRTLTQYETARGAAGRRARAFVRSRTGGAAANAAAILGLIEG